MKSKQVRIVIIISVLVLALVGFYAYLSGKSRDRTTEQKMTALELALSRDLVNDYPPTPKEVMKYYGDIQKCLYGGEATEDEVDDLGMKLRDLYDAELLAQNELGTNLILLRQEVKDYRENNRRLTNFITAASTNVDYYSVDGYSFARMVCVMNINENGVSTSQRMVYLLRKEESSKRWKIYGWDLESNVDLDGDGIPEGEQADRSAQ